MKKVQLILISLLCSFIYGQDTTFYDINFAKVDSKQLATYYQILHYKGEDKSNVTQKTFYISGNIESETHFSDYNKKIKNGKEIKFYQNGQIKRVINYTNDTIDGNLNTFWENGNPKRLDIYIMGKLIVGNCYNSDGEEIKYYNYEILPEFIGGSNALYSYINKKIHYPLEALENNYSGKVTVGFVVSDTGNIFDVKLIKGTEECLNIEALRLVQTMPKWKPGLQDGEIVGMQIGLPIIFNITN